MTDPAGRSFLSYRRTRRGEAALLIETQRDVGIPTWQDVENLDEEPTEAAIRAVLSDPRTSNAVVWLTPDVKDSPHMQNVELPLIQQRAEKEDGFFFVPVTAGGLAYDEVDEVFPNRSSAHDWSERNLRRVTADPIGYGEAIQVASWVLRRRLKVLHERLEPGRALTLSLYTRSPPPQDAGQALVLDWTRQFQQRTARQSAWENNLVPALSRVVGAIGEHAPGRRVIATGLATTSAAAALGYAFMVPKGIRVAWRQVTRFEDAGEWALDSPRQESGFVVRSVPAKPDGGALAVLVGVANDVEPALGRSKGDLPAFRAVLHGDLRPYGQVIGPRQAADIAYRVVEAIKEARREYVGVDRIHVFASVPIGLAMMIGQLLNTCGPVQLYEHVDDDAIGRYVPSVLLEGR